MRRPSSFRTVVTALLLVGLACALARPSAAQSPAAPQTAAPQTAAPAVTPKPSASPSPSGFDNGPTSLVSISADHIAFYYDRFLIEADGHVRIQTSDGFTASGEAFSMDLKLNRYLLAGRVSMTAHGTTVHGAAIANFLDFQRIYLLPITTEPDRWTYLNDDLAHPVKGRIMPGDVFYFPLIEQKPSLTASTAVVGARRYVRFGGVTTYLSGVGVPLGSFVVNFAANPYFAQNSLTGANFDVTWNFAGNDNSLSALHLREDAINGAYLAFEQHFVGQHEYAIFSVNPLTKFERYWNAQLYDRFGTRFQIQTFTQLFTQQYLGLQPYTSTQSTYLTATYAFPHSYLQAASTLTDYNLLGPGAYHTPVPGSSPPVNTGPDDAGSLNHPTSLQITDTSFQNRIGKLPLFEDIFEGYGFNHDSVGSGQYNQVNPPIPVPGLQTFGAPCKVQPVAGQTYYCPAYTTIYNTVLGFTVFAPGIKLGDHDNPYKTYYVNASFSKQRQWNSLPHYIDNTNTTISLSRTFSRPVNAFVSYAVQNTGDYYKVGGYPACNPFVTPSPLPALAQPPSFDGPAAAKPTPTPVPVAPSPNPSCPPSLTAFRGVATLRTLSVGVNYVPQPEFNASLLFRHHDDFPIPVPGLFALPATNVIGQPLYPLYLGQPPDDITPSVRFKLLPHLQAYLTRTYYFHYGTLNWGPTTYVQLSPI